MNNFIRQATWVFLIGLMAVSTAFAQKMETLFYTVDNEESFQSFKNNIGFIDMVGPQTYKVDENGTLSGATDSRILRLAKEQGVKVMPLVTNPGFNQTLIHKLLQNPEAQDRVIRSMVEECARFNYTGFQFDFENVHVTDKQALTSFYQRAAVAFHQKNLQLSIAVVPRSSDFAGSTDYSKWIFENWRGVYDYKALAAAGDFISLMTYDEHTRYTTPGPVAGEPWMEKDLQFVMKEVPPEKISLGIPLYSSYWYSTVQAEQIRPWAQQISYREAMGVTERFGGKPEWNNQDQVFFTIFKHDGQNEYVFFEDSKAFASKLELVKKYKLRGFSSWRLGQEDPEIWKSLARKHP
ncbi:MAG: glycosyl hydrolase family 18 protein [Acidobacteriia bacterium]|nr:glycosyl hydrolase family 18 protein [Terriglobia bacterium]